MRRTATLLTVCLVVVSGCSGLLVSSEDTTTVEGTPTSTTVPPTTFAPTQTATPTATPTPASPANAWQADPIVVSIRDFGIEPREYAPLVRQALDYWEANHTRYTDAEIAYELRPNASDPDIEIRFVEDIKDCGGYDPDSHALGCAPLIQPGETVDERTVVRVRTGYDDKSTLDTLKHELGHTLGLEHRDEPAFMRASALATTLPQPNVTERDYPWQTRDLKVYAAYDLGGLEPRGETAVEEALDYYASGADDTLAVTPRFTFTDDPATAHIVIRLTNDRDLCTGRDYVACQGGIYGVDPDDDGALEYYTQYEIITSDADVDYLSWYVGYYLGFAFGANTVEELPPPFDDRDPKRYW